MDEEYALLLMGLINGLFVLWYLLDLVCNLDLMGLVKCCRMKYILLLMELIDRLLVFVRFHFAQDKIFCEISRLLTRAQNKILKETEKAPFFKYCAKIKNVPSKLKMKN